MGKRNAVWLLGGWLLMLPPMVGDQSNPNAPIEQWEQATAHDSAKECEAAKEKLLPMYHQQEKEIERTPASSATEGKAIKETGVGVLLRFIRAKCVPADQVYPPVQQR